ncbi:MAG: hypothetical protein Phog2KO_10590 [Phototrophicaceae bacterium]
MPCPREKTFIEYLSDKAISKPLYVFGKQLVRERHASPLHKPLLFPITFISLLIVASRKNLEIE